MNGPAYHLRTPRLVLRCPSPEYAPLLHEAVVASVEHLRPWMPWAEAEPEELEARVQRLREFRARFDRDEDYPYTILDPAGGEVLGSTGMHPRLGEASVLEIGYWISARHVGRGYATEAAAGLTRVGFELHRLERMEIRCDPLNARSAAVPRKLRYTLEATLRANVRGVGGVMRDTQVWSLLRGEYAASPAATLRLEAFDAAGRRLL